MPPAPVPARSRPLPRREFARALRLGLGRARQDVRRHGLAGREDLLVQACLRNSAYDPQLDGNLADWLLAIAREGGAVDLVRREMLAASRRTIERRWDQEQVATLLARFAEGGDAAAERALLRMLDRAPPDAKLAGRVVWGLAEEGLRRVVRSYGSRWEQAAEIDWGRIVIIVGEELGVRRARDVVRREARAAHVTQGVVEEFERWTRRGPSRPRVQEQPPGLEDLERLVRKRGPGLVGVGCWTRRATEEERQESWRRLLAKDNVGRLRRRLEGWWVRTPPWFDDRLLQLAEHPDRTVRLRATRVLTYFEDARIRSLALRQLREDPVRAIASESLRLLARSGTDDDAEAVAAALPARASVDTLHDWVRDLTIVAEARGSPAWAPLLRRAYEVSPCRMCREPVLDRLVALDGADRPLLREALLDGNRDVRRIARKALGYR